MKPQRRVGLVALMGLLAAGCSTATLPIDQSNGLPPQPFMTTGLAGEWEVSDGMIEKTVVLDCQGTGRYEWQDGKVFTILVRGSYWAGTWHQSKNDREGGFEVFLSDDRSKAEGRWWYSRIGEERFEQGERGGTFGLMRPVRGKPASDKCRSITTIHEAHGPH